MILTKHDFFGHFFYTDELGRKQGEELSTGGTSSRTSTMYVDGKRHGLCKKWNEDGDLIEIANYYNDDLKGEYILYADNGAVLQHSYFVDNGYFKLEGTIPEKEKFAIKLVHGWEWIPDDLEAT